MSYGKQKRGCFQSNASSFELFKLLSIQIHWLYLLNVVRNYSLFEWKSIFFIDASAFEFQYVEAWLVSLVT